MTAFLLLLLLVVLREAASCVEYLVGLGKPVDRKVIDAEGFDNSLLVAFTEDFGVDHQAAARRQIEHWMMCMADLKKKKDALRVPPLLELREYYAADLSPAATIAFASF